MLGDICHMTLINGSLRMVAKAAERSPTPVLDLFRATGIGLRPLRNPLNPAPPYVSKKDAQSHKRQIQNTTDKKKATAQPRLSLSPTARATKAKQLIAETSAQTLTLTL